MSEGSDTLQSLQWTRTQQHGAQHVPPMGLAIKCDQAKHHRKLFVLRL